MVKFRNLDKFVYLEDSYLTALPEQIVSITQALNDYGKENTDNIRELSDEVILERYDLMLNK